MRTVLMHEGVEVEGIHCWLDLVLVSHYLGEPGYRKLQWHTVLLGPDGDITLEVANSEEQGISHHTAYANGAEMPNSGLTAQPLGGD